MALPSRRAEPQEDPISDSESDDSQGEEGWKDVDEDGDEDTQDIISLLDDRVFPDAMSMLTHCKEAHGFDFLGLRQRLQLDFHGCVKLVNYIRQRVHEGLRVSQDITQSDFEDDAYLKPVLDDDAFIMNLFDLPEVTEDAGVAGDSENNAALVHSLIKRNRELEDEISRMATQFDTFRATVSETLDERWGVKDDIKDDPMTVPSTSAQAKASENDDKKEDESQYYWDSYSSVDIHETMLKDRVRTNAYRDFIYQNKHLFTGKTVLDIGCGSGILSMFCARAGAARVIAVDASNIITRARENIFRAGLQETITTLHGKMEEVTLPVDKVDIIVSEWMGYCLLYEAMLPSVIYARDKYLAPDGLMVPSHTNMWIAPVSDSNYVSEHGPAYWADVYGFDMTAMAKGIYDEARVDHWPKDTVCGSAAAFCMLDLYTVKVEDLSFTAAWNCKFTGDVDSVDGFLIWFDTFFSPEPPTADHKFLTHPVPDDAVADSWIVSAKGERIQDRIAFTTGPYNTETHWKQGFLFCEASSAPKNKKKDTDIRGTITFSVAESNARALNIRVTFHDERGEVTQVWALK
ncbi:S-adenosyl-L-methionine-dependent methyltransferase [Xylariaceae sp. FL1272]|nr:S-adenosyl-L-methionine-dependent methyltransferase [Xylariaceae sp. FL1272]